MNPALGDCLQMSDGSEERVRSRFQALLGQASLATQYLSCDHGAVSCHIRHLRDIADRSSQTLSRSHDWVVGLLSSYDHEVDVCFIDGSLCSARSVPLVSEKGRKSRVEINLGALPRLLGCANRLHAMLDSTYLTEYGSFDCGGVGGAPWDPKNDPLGVLQTDINGSLEPSIAVALDALQLMYFHEVSHIVAGHMFLPIMTQKNHSDYDRFHRAVESEADWGSGWLFLAHTADELGLDRLKSDQVTVTKLVNRLTIAATCNYVASQISNNPANAGKRYHLPPVRMTCTLAGGDNWWSAAIGGVNNFTEAADASLLQFAT